MIVGERFRDFEHTWQAHADFLFAASGKERDNGFVGVGNGVGSGILAIGGNGIDRGVANVVDVVVVLLEEIGLKRQNGVHVVNEPLDALDAPCLPRPYFRRDIVVDGSGRENLFGELRYVKVEGWVVDEDEQVGRIGLERLLASLDVSEHRAEVECHVDESHERHVAIVNDRFVSDGGSHEVASKELEVGLWVFLLESLDEVGGMEVAGGFARDDEIAHRIFIEKEEVTCR